MQKVQSRKNETLRKMEKKYPEGNKIPREEKVIELPCLRVFRAL